MFQITIIMAPIQSLHVCVALSLVALFSRISATSQPSELESAEESAHSYTNIEFARESSQGTPRRMKGGFGQGNNR